MAMPKEPRQKMINIMYLVLTALLALNVSSEIINAFKTINNSLVTSNGIVEEKNKTIFESFKQKLDDQKTKEKAEIWFPVANDVKKQTDDLYNYIENLKEELKKEAGLGKMGKDESGQEIYKEDDLEAATRLLVEKAPIGKDKGAELKKKLEDYKNAILTNAAVKAKFDKTLPIDLSVPKSKSNNEASKDWAYAYFHMSPTVAAMTILSKFQNDIRNSEAQIVAFCHDQVGAVEVRFDAFQALYGQSSEYLMPGQELKITGGIGAYSSAAKPTITIDGSPVPLNAQGVGEYKTTVGGPGSYSKKLRIVYKDQDGKDQSKDVDIKYTVGSPTGSSVSADATKVFYIGLDNPISVSGGSAGDERTQVTIDNGSLNKTGPGKFMVQVNGGTESNVTVTVDGKNPTPFKFRVKPVPDPVGMVGRSKGGRIPANEFKGQSGVRAELENFIFEGVKYQVTGYVLYATGKNFTEAPGISQNAGAAFNEQSRQILSRAVAGTTIIIDELKAVGPGNKSVKLPPIPFVLY